jgi:molybdenum cofactor cytidylyltransferase
MPTNAAVVLAAGMSTRMGTLKQMLPFGKSTVLGSVIDSLRAASVDRIIVVLGHEAEKIRQSVSGSKAEFVVNEDYVLGMFSSVQAGVRTLTPDTETFLICLGDQPGIRGGTIRTLLETFSKCGKGIGIPFADEDQGHPLFVSGKYLNELQLMAPTLTLKHFLSAHSTDTARLPVQDPAILRDIDTQADYESELRRYNCDI